MKRRPGETLRNAIAGLAFLGTLAGLIAVNPMKRPSERARALDQASLDQASLDQASRSARCRRAFALGYYLGACPGASNRVKGALLNTIVLLADSLSVPDSALKRLRTQEANCSFDDTTAIALVVQGIDPAAADFLFLGYLAALQSELRRGGSSQDKRYVDSLIESVSLLVIPIAIPLRYWEGTVRQFRAGGIDVNQFYRILFGTSNALTPILEPRDLIGPTP